MSPLVPALHDAVAGGHADPDRLPFPHMEIPFDHPSTPICPVYQIPPES